MNDLKVFDYEGSQVRTVLVGDEPWWVLRDVCDVLGIKDPSMVAMRLDADERGTSRIGTPGGMQNLTIINESGLYSVILRSDKLEARAFRKWITSEVLPSIRRTGSYSKEQPKGKELLALAILEAQRMIEAKDQEIAILAPKAAAADRITNAAGLKSLSDIGKINGIGPRKIFELLADRGILFRRGDSWVPYQQYIEYGYFLVRESTYEMNGIDHLYSKTYVTGKGEIWVAKQLCAA
jgi:anti-repressor protein